MNENKNKKVIKLLSAGHFITDAYSGFLNPIMPFIAANIGISMTIATILISISNLTSSLSQPFFGFMADKWQRRFFIFWGMLTASIFLSFLGLANNIYILILCLFLGHMGVAFYHPQATSLVSCYSKDSINGKEMSIFIASGTFGFALGPAISSSIADLWGLNKLPFACIFGIIFAFVLLHNIPKISEVSISKPNTSLSEATKKIFSHKAVAVLVAASIVKSFVVSSFNIILPFYWKTINFSISKIGVILFAFMMAGALGVISSPYFEKYLGVKKLFYLSLAAVTPLGLIFYFTHGEGIIGIISFILIGYVSFLAVPVNMSLAQKLMPDFKSMISGFIGGFSWGVIGLVLPLISYTAKYTGILNILLFITFIPLFFSYFIKYLPEKE